MPDGRATGLKFGQSALDYQRGRPDWPEEVLAGIPVPPDAYVLDLAAGTGKLTRLLTRRYANVVAVEPDDAMRALIEDVEAHRGTAEAIPLPDASFDAVFVAEAFHWFDAERALGEIARVLRPRGFLVLLWSAVWDWDPPMPDEAMELLSEVFVRMGRPGGPSYASGEWRSSLEGSPFEPLRERHFRRELVLDADRTVSLWLSVSSVAALPDDERAALGERLRALVTEARRFMPRTDLHWTRLRA